MENNLLFKLSILLLMFGNLCISSTWMIMCTVGVFQFMFHVLQASHVIIHIQLIRLQLLFEADIFTRQLLSSMLAHTRMFLTSQRSRVSLHQFAVMPALASFQLLVTTLKRVSVQT